MSGKFRTYLLIAFGSLCLFRAYAADYSDELERSIPLRSSGELQITNNRGDISIEAWSQDKVRLKIHRRAQADTPEEGKRLLQATDIRHRVSPEGIEISAEYGHGLSLEERLKERASPRASMSMNLLAPARLRLRVWAVNGRVSVKGWKGGLEVRSNSGPVSIENVNSETVSVMCPACEVRMTDVKSQSVRLMGGTGAVFLNRVDSGFTYVESESGPVETNQVRGEQLFVSKTAPLNLKASSGRIGFHAQQGAVMIQDASGFVSGNTSSGNITARMKRWSFVEDKVVIESGSGDVFLSLPRSFSGELDLFSGSGTVQSDFQLRQDDAARSTTSPSQGRLLGVVGENSGDVLRVFSEKGAVRVSVWK